MLGYGKYGKLIVKLCIVYLITLHVLECVYAMIILAGVQINQVRQYIHKCTHDISCNCRIL